MTIIWTEQRLQDSLKYSWDEFQNVHPGISNYNGWKAARTEARQRGIIAQYDPNGETDLAETLSELPPYEVRADGDIFINRVSRTIVTNLGSEFGSVTFSFERHAAMRRRYSDEWENDSETIPTIARDFDFHPKAFERYKSMHGWTHASDPFADHEWEEGLDVEEAVAQTIESHRRAFHKKLQKEKWAQIIEDADKWRRFHETALVPIVDSIRQYASDYTPPQIQITDAVRPYDVVLCPTDVHFGKYGWADETGRSYSKQEASRILVDTTERIIRTLVRHGRPSRIITAVGSDFFHVDNEQGGTTSGTPQDLDGTSHQMFWEGAELAITQFSMLRQVAPLDIYYMPGNHDRMLGYALLCTVRAWFRNDPDVTVHESPAPRKYIKSGQTLIGFAHGDGPKPKDLPLLMAVEASELWGKTRHRIWMTGHLHHEMTLDTQGVLTMQLASISGNDRYHANKGYANARRNLAAFIIDHEDGLIGTIIAPVLGYYPV